MINVNCGRRSIGPPPAASNQHSSSEYSFLPSSPKSSGPGSKSKVSSALVGTFTYVLLSNDLTTMGVGLEMINFVKAVIFIAIILLTCRKRGGVLPR